MARGIIIGIGIIFLIIAVIGYSTPISITIADTTVNPTIPQMVAFCDSGIGQFAQMSPQVVLVCSEYNNFMMGIYGSGLLGIILIIVGAVSSEKKSIYFCKHCKFAASTEAELYNHSVKEHNDESGFAEEQKREDESTFKYKDEEIQPETYSQKALPKKPKRDLKKSPTLKGIIIGIIAMSIIYGSIWGLNYQAFVMTNDAMAPTINKGDLIRYDNTPFDEIQVNDIIFYSDPIEEPKTRVHKVISVDSSKVPRTLTVRSEADIAPHLLVLEEQYIGKLDSVIEGGGFFVRILSPGILIGILIVAFAIPIIVMKIRDEITKN